MGNFTKLNGIKGLNKATRGMSLSTITICYRKHPLNCCELTEFQGHRRQAKQRIIFISLISLG